MSSAASRRGLGVIDHIFGRATTKAKEQSVTHKSAHTRSVPKTAKTSRTLSGTIGKTAPVIKVTATGAAEAEAVATHTGGVRAASPNGSSALTTLASLNHRGVIPERTAASEPGQSETDTERPADVTEIEPTILPRSALTPDAILAARTPGWYRPPAEDASLRGTAPANTSVSPFDHPLAISTVSSTPPSTNTKDPIGPRDTPTAGADGTTTAYTDNCAMLTPSTVTVVGPTATTGSPLQSTSAAAAESDMSYTTVTVQPTGPPAESSAPVVISNSSPMTYGNGEWADGCDAVLPISA